MQNGIDNNLKIKTDRLFWEKYRPQTLDDLIIPNRIKTIVKHGINTNMLLVGPPGIGKSSLANILTKNHPFIRLNSKLGVEILRNEVLQFCQTIVSNVFETNNKNMKVVWLEEFDGATRQLQEELRAFIEQFEKNVRFIATANNLSKITDAIQSRFDVIDFTPKNQDEIKQLKVEFLKRLIKINDTDNLNINHENIKEIVKSTFPDLRKCMSKLQLAHVSGSIDLEEQYAGDYEIYQIISQPISPQETWNYLYINWLDRLDNAFAMFGRNYWKWVEENKPNEINKMPNRMIKISQYIDCHLTNARDPFVTLCAMIYELQNL